MELNSRSGYHGLMSMTVHPAAPQLFISSTVREFRDLRGMLAAILRAQGIRVLLSEHTDFEVRGDRSAIEECFANIRASSHYVLIIGGRAGTLLNDGASITRQELRVARDAFLATGKPAIRMFLLEEVDLARPGVEEALRKCGATDVEHLNAFIEEAQSHADANVPTYLTRFSDGSKVLDAVSSWLNLGRDFRETLLRYALLRELSSNIARMVDRSGRTVFPHHWYMHLMRDAVQLSPEQYLGPDAEVNLTREQATHLVLALLGRCHGRYLSTRVMESALDSGLFLDFDTVDSTLRETPLHRALATAIDDIRSLSGLDTGGTAQEWDNNLVFGASGQLNRHQSVVRVAVPDIAWACSHYDRVRDVYEGHVWMCRVLHGIVPEEVETYVRSPLTPLGEKEERGLWAETITGEEIRQLFEQQVSPFGGRELAERLGKTREEQTAALKAQLGAAFAHAGIDAKILDRFDDAFYENMVIGPEGGLESRTRKP